MTTFSISDFTLAGAFCGAMNAANESDRNNRVSDRATGETAKTKSLLALVGERIEAILQSFHKSHAETA